MKDGPGGSLNFEMFDIVGERMSRVEYVLGYGAPDRQLQDDETFRGCKVDG